jgi:hypothetical protein
MMTYGFNKASTENLKALPVMTLTPFNFFFDI